MTSSIGLRWNHPQAMMLKDNLGGGKTPPNLFYIMETRDERPISLGREVSTKNY
jgi:hypothetical protein